jgi:hypothetical protein
MLPAADSGMQRYFRVAQYLAPADGGDSRTRGFIRRQTALSVAANARLFAAALF